MMRAIDRRGFLRAAGALTAGAGLLGTDAFALGASGSATRAVTGKGAPHAKKLGWRLGCQAWTFNNLSFYEAIDKTASLGLHYIEAFPGQKLSPQKPNVPFKEGLSAADRKEVLKKLSDSGVKLVNYGVGGYGKQSFDFAKEMGIETLVSEPPQNEFDKLDKLCDEYKINIALHDHPKPSRYWSPDIVLAACKGHSKRIGACCDTGHWMRSDINPVEALKKLQGRIISFHLKDLNRYGEGAHDVVWGTGKGDVKAMLAEVKRQGIKPVFSIEYEYRFTMDDLARCVAYFDKVCAELAQA